MTRKLKQVAAGTRRMLRCDRGQGLVEYALILVLIAVVVIAAIKTVGTSASSTFSNINNGMTTQ